VVSHQFWSCFACELLIPKQFSPVFTKFWIWNYDFTPVFALFWLQFTDPPRVNWKIVLFYFGNIYDLCWIDRNEYIYILFKYVCIFRNICLVYYSTCSSIYFCLICIYAIYQYFRYFSKYLNINKFLYLFQKLFVNSYTHTHLDFYIYRFSVHVDFLVKTYVFAISQFSCRHLYLYIYI
jgi:hypothetical protein